MAIFFVSSALLVSAILLVIEVIWLLAILNPRRDIYGKVMYLKILTNALISYIVLVLGAWLWMFFSQPNNVSRNWFFILLLLVFALISPYLMGRFNFKAGSAGSPVVAGVFFFAIIFFLSKFLIILGMIAFFFVSLSRSPVKVRRVKISKQFSRFLIVIIVLTLGSISISTPVDNANYFDELLTYDSGLPFHTKIDGAELRVVDYELAKQIMLKSNLLGSNTIITDIHLGKINGTTSWIGAVSFDGNKFFRQKLNHYQGFIAVDFRDPQVSPILISEEFHVGAALVLNKKLSRVVYNHNSEYIIGDNTYFTQDSSGDMKLIVPYSIQANMYFGQSGAGIVTQEIQKMGGILEFDADGQLVKDYTDLTELPEHANVQLYSEIWLERSIDYWARSIKEYHEFGTFTHFGGVFKSPLLMGIDDDVRVIIDPDTKEDVQYILLDSTGSENQILRGAIKANASGLFFYDWSSYGFIDTNTAHEHGSTALVNYFQNTVHAYTTLLPVLYPIKDNPTSLNDYAYVMPLQLNNIQFGGVVVTDPSDATGIHSAVQIVETGSNKNISQLVELAINDYIAHSPSTNETGAISGTFDIDTIYSYVSEGNTIYTMEGNLTIDLDVTYVTIVFKQEFISELEDWLKVVQAESGDQLSVKLFSEGNVLIATSVG